MNKNPYAPPTADARLANSQAVRVRRRGPSLYLAVGCLAGIGLAVALDSVASPHIDLGFPAIILCLIGMPLGGAVYRFRSRKWNYDKSANSRIIRYSLYSMALPAITAILTGMRAQGMKMTILCGAISISFATGALLAGSRRNNA